MLYDEKQYSTIIKKAEFQIPSYAQLYSDLYIEYLHSMNDIYGTYYISEKEFFDNLGIDQNVLRFIDNYFKSMTDIYSSQIDISTVSYEPMFKCEFQQ